MFLKTKRNDISPALTRMLAMAKRPRPVVRAMGTTFKSITEGNFNSAGAEFRPTPWRAKADGNPSNLLKSTTLAHSFHLQVEERTAEVSTPVPYAGIHQYGGVILPKDKKALRFQINGQWVMVKKVVMPPRPFFPVLGGKLTEKAEKLILRAGERVAAKQIGATET